MKIEQIFSLNELYNDDTLHFREELIKLQENGVNVSNMYQEMEMRSRYVDTHIDTSFGDIPINLHSHSFYEIVYVTSNSGTQYLVGGKRYTLQPGDIVIVPPGIGHKPLFPSELAEPYRRIVLWVSSEFVQAVSHVVPTYIPKFKTQTFLLRTANTPYQSIGQLFRCGLKEAQEKRECWQVALCANTMQLLVECIRAFSEPENHLLVNEKPELLDDVVSYIETHLSEKITLADTAQRFFVSESTISQTFQKKMHVSFYHYVTQRRLIAAKSLILEERNLDILSEKVGFSDYSTFYRAFKKEFGISPKEYRNLIAENSQNLV